MFLPIGDSPNPERFTPYVTWGIIGINVAIFVFINLPLSSRPVDASSPLLAEYVRMLLDQGIPTVQIRALLAQTSLNDLLLFHYGYKPASPSLISLFASLFLHGGFMHLFGNMLFLYIYGDNVEHQLGRFRYLAVYLATGVVATLSFAFLAGNSLTPLVGASGAISGILGYYFLKFPKNKVKVFILLFPIFMNVVRIPARIVLGIFVVVDNLLPLLTQAGGNVAHGAHLGGFIAGLGVAALGGTHWDLSFLKKASANAQPSRFNSVRKPPAAASFRERMLVAVASADAEQLLKTVRDGGVREFQTLEVETIFAAVTIFKKRGFLEAANKLLKLALTAHHNSPLLPELYCELGEIRLQQGFATAAYQHFLTALDLHPTARTEARIRELLTMIRL